MQRTTQRTEPLMPLMVTQSELVAIGGAITHYQIYLERTPEKRKEFQDVIALLEGFQKRLTQLPPLPTPQETATYGQP